MELRPGSRLGGDAPAAAQADYPRFRRLTFYGVLAGLCPLVPVPLVDDWALGRVRRRMVREIAERHGARLTPVEVRILAGGEEPGAGCLGAAARGVRTLVVAVARKLLRTFVLVLTFRESVRLAALTVSEAYLFELAGRRGALGRGEAAARRLRSAIHGALAAADVRSTRRIVGRAFRGSAGLLARAAAALGPLGRKGAGEAAEAEAFGREEGLLAGLVEELAASLWGNRRDLDALERELDRRLPA